MKSFNFYVVSLTHAFDFFMKLIRFVALRNFQYDSKLGTMYFKKSFVPGPVIENGILFAKGKNELKNSLRCLEIILKALTDFNFIN